MYTLHYTPLYITLILKNQYSRNTVLFYSLIHVLLEIAILKLLDTVIGVSDISHLIGLGLIIYSYLCEIFVEINFREE